MKLWMYVVYDHPKDYPDAWVVRRFRMTKMGEKMEPEEQLWGAATDDKGLACLRADLCLQGLVCLGRSQGDDSCILEVWI